ncbi:MAG: hypothetical protein NVS3B10_05970 [Polyangiales bacterium]
MRAPFVVTALASFAAAGCHVSDASVDRPDADDARASEVTGDAGGEPLADGPSDAPPTNPAECPADDPGFGGHKPCAVPESVRCAYVDACPTHPVTAPYDVYACHDDGTGARWTLVSDPYTPPCPIAQPNDGDPCPCSVHMAYLACNYGACEAMSRIYAACKGVDSFDRVWHVGPIACNPPEADAGHDASDAALDAPGGG